MKAETKTKKKASSLLEVMIVLGIISTVLTVAANLIISSLYQIKENEILDSANAAMVKALEVAKSPANVVVSKIPDQRNRKYLYSLAMDSNGNYFLQDRQSDITTCTSESEYYVDLSILGLSDMSHVTACVQLLIIPQGAPGGSIDSYEITSIVYYVLKDKTEYNLMKGVRYGEFIL